MKGMFYILVFLLVCASPVLLAVFILKSPTLKRGWSAFKKATTPEGRVVLVVILVLTLWGGFAIIYTMVFDASTEYHATPTEELHLARSFCPPTPDGGLLCVESEMDIALRHLEKIPTSAPEYSEATKLRSSIQTFRVRLEAARQRQAEELAAAQAKQQAEHDRLVHQSIEESRDQMWRNVLGQAHDSFTCSTSSENSPIISFDYGHYWWNDDGRCAAQQQQERETAEKIAQQKRETAGKIAQQKRWEEQRARDSDAELSSYWPKTIRVDTDMDSFWLVNEERTCQTYPDDKGRVAIVSCNAGGSHKDHNIPVTFWGGVDRNTVSDWKCRRESDQFVCRALN